MRKFVSWNVNGLRACREKGFMDFFSEIDADVLAIQETKLQPGQIELDTPGYAQYFNSAEKKGYSGTAVFSRIAPISVTYDFPDAKEDGFGDEGRVITLEFDDLYFVCCYTPNSQRELLRLEYRMRWEDAFLAYLKALDAKKPVVLCGDLNVAHCEIDLKHPKSNHKNAGFTDEERQKFTTLLENGFADSFRRLYPDRRDAYSWWSYMGGARAKNVGWRIDYFVVSERLMESVCDSEIRPDVMGSDHCPVVLTLK